MGSVALALLGLSALVACSDGQSAPAEQVAGSPAAGSASVGGSSGSSSGATATGGQGGTGEAGGTPGGSGAGGQGGSPASGRESGQVTIASLYFTPDSGLGYSGIGAIFGSASLHPADCAYQTYGLCTIDTCGTPPTPSNAPHAGAITVSSDSAGQGPFLHTIEPGSDGQYATWTTGMPVFYPNNLLQVVASGGTVPAFSSGMLGYPADFQLTSPSVAATETHLATLSLSRAEDFKLAWDKRVEDTILSIQTDPAVKPGLVCRVPSTLGEFTIPKEALAQVPAGTQGDFYVLRQVVVPAGNFDVTLRLATLLLSPDRSQRIVFEVGD